MSFFRTRFCHVALLLGFPYLLTIYHFSTVNDPADTMPSADSGAAGNNPSPRRHQLHVDLADKAHHALRTHLTQAPRYHALHEPGVAGHGHHQPAQQKAAGQTAAHKVAAHKVAAVVKSAADQRVTEQAAAHKAANVSPRKARLDVVRRSSFLDKAAAQLTAQKVANEKAAAEMAAAKKKAVAQLAAKKVAEKTAAEKVAIDKASADQRSRRRVAHKAAVAKLAADKANTHTHAKASAAQEVAAEAAAEPDHAAAAAATAAAAAAATFDQAGAGTGAGAGDGGDRDPSWMSRALTSQGPTEFLGGSMYKFKDVGFTITVGDENGVERGLVWFDAEYSHPKRCVPCNNPVL
jgi:hypothetical protein